MRRTSWINVLLTSALLGCSVEARAASCGSLRSLSLESTAITTAEQVDNGTLAPPYGSSLASLPAFCRIAGVIRPTHDSEIGFEVWMPVENWNGRFLGVGNGGFAGTINYGQMGSSLRHGFATASTDTGHQAGAEDASWAFHHPEKITDYGYRALHLTTLRAKEILAAFYRRPAEHAYFDSCSNGGREALMEAQRFPEDYDGILAGAPANSWTRMLSSAIDVVQTMTDDPAAYISAMKLPAIHRAVLEACDAQDGVKDGILNDPSQCRFDPATLLCKREDSLTCLTAPQVKTLRKLYAGGADGKGHSLFPGYLPGSELPAWDSWVVGSGPGAGAGSRYPVNFFRYMVTGDSKWEILNAEAGRSQAEAEKIVGRDLNAVDPDLARFTARGGKLVLYHGWNDSAISPWNTISYFKRVRETLGAEKADTSIRLYMAPGMEHCSGGPGANSFGQLGLPAANGRGSGALDQLQQWVEHGTAPGPIIAARFEGGDERAAPVMSRPLCPYPQVASYNGSGSPERAASFTCRAR